MFDPPRPAPDYLEFTRVDAEQYNKTFDRTPAPG